MALAVAARSDYERYDGLFLKTSQTLQVVASHCSKSQCSTTRHSVSVSLILFNVSAEFPKTVADILYCYWLKMGGNSPNLSVIERLVGKKKAKKIAGSGILGAINIKLTTPNHKNILSLVDSLFAEINEPLRRCATDAIVRWGQRDTTKKASALFPSLLRETPKKSTNTEFQLNSGVLKDLLDQLVEVRGQILHGRKSPIWKLIPMSEAIAYCSSLFHVISSLAEELESAFKCNLNFALQPVALPVADMVALPPWQKSISEYYENPLQILSAVASMEDLPSQLADPFFHATMQGSFAELLQLFIEVVVNVWMAANCEQLQGPKTNLFLSMRERLIKILPEPSLDKLAEAENADFNDFNCFVKSFQAYLLVAAELMITEYNFKKLSMICKFFDVDESVIKEWAEHCQVLYECPMLARLPRSSKTIAAVDEIFKLRNKFAHGLEITDVLTIEDALSICQLTKDISEAFIEKIPQSARLSLRKFHQFDIILAAISTTKSESPNYKLSIYRFAILMAAEQLVGICASFECSQARTIMLRYIGCIYFCLGGILEITEPNTFQQGLAAIREEVFKKCNFVRKRHYEDIFHIFLHCKSIYNSQPFHSSFSKELLSLDEICRLALRMKAFKHISFEMGHGTSRRLCLAKVQSDWNMQELAETSNNANRITSSEVRATYFLNNVGQPPEIKYYNNLVVAEEEFYHCLAESIGPLLQCSNSRVHESIMRSVSPVLAELDISLVTVIKLMLRYQGIDILEDTVQRLFDGPRGNPLTSVLREIDKWTYTDLFKNDQKLGPYCNRDILLKAIDVRCRLKEDQLPFVMAADAVRAFERIGKLLREQCKDFASLLRNSGVMDILRPTRISLYHITIMYPRKTAYFEKTITGLEQQFDSLSPVVSEGFYSQQIQIAEDEFCALVAEMLTWLWLELDGCPCNDIAKCQVIDRMVNVLSDKVLTCFGKADFWRLATQDLARTDNIATIDHIFDAAFFSCLGTSGNPFEAALCSKFHYQADELFENDKPSRSDKRHREVLRQVFKMIREQREDTTSASINKVRQVCYALCAIARSLRDAFMNVGDLPENIRHSIEQIKISELPVSYRKRHSEVKQRIKGDSSSVDSLLDVTTDTCALDELCQEMDELGVASLQPQRYCLAVICQKALVHIGKLYCKVKFLIDETDSATLTSLEIFEGVRSMGKAIRWTPSDVRAILQLLETPTKIAFDDKDRCFVFGGVKGVIRLTPAEVYHLSMKFKVFSIGVLSAKNKEVEFGDDESSSNSDDALSDLVEMDENETLDASSKGLQVARMRSLWKFTNSHLAAFGNFPKAIAPKPQAYFGKTVDLLKCCDQYTPGDLNLNTLHQVAILTITRDLMEPIVDVLSDIVSSHVTSNDEGFKRLLRDLPSSSDRHQVETVQKNRGTKEAVLLLLRYFLATPTLYGIERVLQRFPQLEAVRQSIKKWGKSSRLRCPLFTSTSTTNGHVFEKIWHTRHDLLHNTKFDLTLSKSTTLNFYIVAKQLAGEIFEVCSKTKCVFKEFYCCPQPFEDKKFSATNRGVDYFQRNADINKYLAFFERSADNEDGALSSLAYAAVLMAQADFERAITELLVIVLKKCSPPSLTKEFISKMKKKLGKKICRGKRLNLRFAVYHFLLPLSLGKISALFEVFPAQAEKQRVTLPDCSMFGAISEWGQEMTVRFIACPLSNAIRASALVSNKASLEALLSMKKELAHDHRRKLNFEDALFAHLAFTDCINSMISEISQKLIDSDLLEPLRRKISSPEIKTDDRDRMFCLVGDTKIRCMPLKMTVFGDNNMHRLTSR